MSRYEIFGLLIKKSIPIGLVLVSTVMTLLLGELLVRFVVNPGDFLVASMIDDPMLGQRIKPNTTGHDALGFRNAEVPERANVVAIGDSQTYGVSASRDGSWPHQLGELIHEPVYNMALGGYGPLQYLYLAEHEAKKLRPQQLLVGLYFGNDLIDAYRLARHSPYWSSWRERGSAESDGPEEQQTANEEPKKRFADLRDWLSRHSVLYSMLRITLFSEFSSREQDLIAMQVTTDQRIIWVDPSGRSVRTIFTPQSRLFALDMQLPNVQEGLRITKRAFASLQKEAVARDEELLIVLIPTKERVYCHYIKDSGGLMPTTFISLCEAEERIKGDLEQFFDTNKIAYVDVTKALEEQTYKHIQIYPKDSDGHPLAIGYGVIARTVYDTVRRLQKEK
ncbi:MAG: SGNH/GDSL hydrolase family protein [Pseudomonadota bacterium]